MCSSPKSSGSSQPRTQIKSLAESLTSEQRARFTLVANRAEERRQQRQVINKQWQQRQASKPRQSKPKQAVRAGKNTAITTSISAWLSQVFFAFR